MGCNHRHLSDDEFTGKHLKGLPAGSGNPGAAPPIPLLPTAFVIVGIAIGLAAVVNFYP